MSRTDQKKKDRERLLIREFVCCALGYTVSRAEWRESPDAVLALRKTKIKRRVAIEHTGYFNDTDDKRAEQSRISHFWKHVQTSLSRRISRRKHLAGVSGAVQLSTKAFAGRLDRKTLAARFAEELVDFLEAHPISRSARFPSHSAASRGTEFSDFPTLSSLVDSMRLERIPGIDYFSRHRWRCLNITAGPIGLNLNYIRTIIEKKNEKATEYRWERAGGRIDEKWLLIVAAGDSLSTHAGWPEEQNWNDAKLRALCCESPFDRIYFWERAVRSYKLLKPNRRAVCAPRKKGANKGRH